MTHGPDPVNFSGYRAGGHGRHELGRGNLLRLLRRRRKIELAIGVEVELARFLGNASRYVIGSRRDVPVRALSHAWRVLFPVEGVCNGTRDHHPMIGPRVGMGRRGGLTGEDPEGAVGPFAAIAPPGAQLDEWRNLLEVDFGRRRGYGPPRTLCGEFIDGREVEGMVGSAIETSPLPRLLTFRYPCIIVRA